MRKWAFLPALVLLLVVGCGGDKPKFTEQQLAQMPSPQRQGLPECSGGFVLVVGEETITSDQVIAPLIERLRPLAQSADFEQFKKQVRPRIEQVVDARVSRILIYSQAKKDAGEDIDENLDEAAEAEVRRFVVSFGGDYSKAEDTLKKMGRDWASFKEHQKRLILNQSYIASQMPNPGPVTHTDLINCYNKMKDEFFATPAMLNFQLIDIQPVELELNDPNQSCLEQARGLADDLLKRLQAGEDFGTLAKEYLGALFIDHSNGIQPDSLAAPYDKLVAEVEKIQPGQVAGPIETPQQEHIFIIKLIEKRPKTFEPFEKVQKQVERKIILDRQRQALDELEAKLAQQAKIPNKDEFIDFCLQKIYQMSNE